MDAGADSSNSARSLVRACDRVDDAEAEAKPDLAARAGAAVAEQEITAKLPPAHVPLASIRPGEWHSFAVSNRELHYFDENGRRASRH